MPTALDRRSFVSKLAAGLAAGMWFGGPRPAPAATTSIEPYLGEIMLIACNFPPTGWAFCNGQILPISQNQGLFSLLGTTYGGNGQTTFALPDLRDRVPIHFGQGPGLTPRNLGERSGATTHVLAVSELPAHTHGLRVSSGMGTTASPTGMFPALNPASNPQYGATPDVAMSSSAIQGVGGGQGHTNLQPTLCLNFVIALQGTFPPR